MNFQREHIRETKITLISIESVHVHYCNTVTLPLALASAELCFHTGSE